MEKVTKSLHVYLDHRIYRVWTQMMSEMACQRFHSPDTSQIQQQIFLTLYSTFVELERILLSPSSVLMDCDISYVTVHRTACFSTVVCPLVFFVILKQKQRPILCVYFVFIAKEGGSLIASKFNATPFISLGQADINNGKHSIHGTECAEKIQYSGSSVTAF